MTDLRGKAGIVGSRGSKDSEIRDLAKNDIESASEPVKLFAISALSRTMGNPEGFLQDFVRVVLTGLLACRTFQALANNEAISPVAIAAKGGFCPEVFGPDSISTL